MSDTLPENARHTSLLVNNLEYGPFNTIKNYDFTDCKELYDKMQADRYNAIRDDKRFIAVLEKSADIVDSPNKEVKYNGYR